MKKLFSFFVFSALFLSCQEKAKPTTTINSNDAANAVIDSITNDVILQSVSNHPHQAHIDSLIKVYLKRFFNEKKMTVRSQQKYYQDSSYTHIEFLQDDSLRWIPMKHILINDSSLTEYYLDPLTDSLHDLTPKNRNVLFNHVYTWNLGYTEHQRKISDDKVFIVLKGNYITVYDLKNNPQASKPIVNGFVIRHSSGKFVVVEDPKAPEPLEIGGCSDHPYILDFEQKVLWGC